MFVPLAFDNVLGVSLAQKASEWTEGTKNAMGGGKPSKFGLRLLRKTKSKQKGGSPAQPPAGRP